MSEQPVQAPNPGWQGQVFCANCRGGNAPQAERCQWCGMPLTTNQPLPYQYPPQYQQGVTLSPAERNRIAEEQRIRDRETMKTGLSVLGWVLLAVGGIVVVMLLAFCFICSGTFNLFKLS